MRRQIIILLILLFAGPVFAQYPVEYHCQADISRPAEAVFCEIFKERLLASDMVIYKVDENRPYFQIIVLPTVRDSYTSVTVASNFMYPPLAGLALSAYLSSYILTPVQGEDLEKCIDYMVRKNIAGISEWMVWFGEKTHRIRPNNVLRQAVKPDDSLVEGPTLEVSNE